MSDESPGYSLLPANSSALERALDLGFAKLLDRIAPPFPELMNPDATPAEFLPYLGADRGVSEWSSDAPESEKRLTVALAWPTKRQAGTRKALEGAVMGLQLVPEVRAWFEQVPPGAPYSFTVRAFSSLPYSPEIDARLDQRLADAKSERDTLSVSVGLGAAGTHYIGAATVCGELTTVYPIVIGGVEASGNAFRGAGLYVVEKTTVYPQVS